MNTSSFNIKPGQRIDVGRGEIVMDGHDNVVIRNIEGSNITVNIGKFAEWHELNDQLKDYQELFTHFSLDDIGKSVDLSKKIDRQKKKIADFKSNVINMAEVFSRIEINSERLKKAKEYFDNGSVREAQAVLETELDQIYGEQEVLLKKRDEYQKDILPKLQNNAEEFFLLALASEVEYQNPEHIENAYNYYERSLNSFLTRKALVKYIELLQDYGNPSEAETIYSVLFDNFQNEFSPRELLSHVANLALLQQNSNKPEQAMSNITQGLKIVGVIEGGLNDEEKSLFSFQLANILSTTGVIYLSLNQFDKALSKLEQSLNILSSLKDGEFEDIPLAKSMVLGNLGNFLSLTGSYDKALSHYHWAMEIQKDLATKEGGKFEPLVSDTFNNLGNLYLRKENYQLALENYEKSLKIRSKFAQFYPKVFLSGVAEVLHNSAIALKLLGENDKALERLFESLETRLILAQTEPRAYFPLAALTAKVIASIYQTNIPNKKESIKFAGKALTYLMLVNDTIKESPATQQYLDDTLEILMVWGLSPSEIESLFKENAIIKADGNESPQN